MNMISFFFFLSFAFLFLVAGNERSVDSRGIAMSIAWQNIDKSTLFFSPRVASKELYKRISGGWGLNWSFKVHFSERKINKSFVIIFVLVHVLVVTITIIS